jgi:hypothetical protein
MEKQRGMAFGFRKAATAVIEPDREREKQEILVNVLWKFYVLRMQPHKVESGFGR